MFHLCDLCQSSEQLLEEFSKFNMSENYRDEQELSNLFNYGINPIVPIIFENLKIKVFKNEVDRNLLKTLDQICQFQRNCNFKQYYQHDFLYGWDYLIKFFQLNNQAQQSHFKIFKLIMANSYEHNEQLSGVNQNANFEIYMDHIYQKCQKLLKNIYIQDENKNLSQLKSQYKITDLIMKFRVQQFNSLFNEIEKVFLYNYTPKTNQNIFQEYFKYKILLSALIQEDNIDISTSLIYCKFSSQISIEKICIIILPYFNISHRVWALNFTSLQYPQRISLISNIIDRFKTGQLSLFNLLLLAKKMKIMKEYYLSLILFNLYRSLCQKKGQYISYAQYQMGKLCLYLKQFEDSFSLYKESLQNFDQQQNSIHISKLKIIIKIIIVSIFTNHKDTRKQVIEIFMKGIKKNEITATSSQASFVFYISDLLYKNKQLQEALTQSQFMNKYCSFIFFAGNFTLPTQTLQKIVDCQELKNSIANSSSRSLLGTFVGIVSKSRSVMIDRQDSQSFFKKSEAKLDMPQFPEKSNLFDTYLQLLLLIYTNFATSNDQWDFSLYMSNKDKITITLQSMNLQTLSFLPTILNECQITRQELSALRYQFYYDKFYKAHIYMYLRQYTDAEMQINSINISDIFKQFKNTKSSDQQEFTNEFLRLKTRCLIGLGQIQFQQCKDPQIQYEIGCYYYKLYLNDHNFNYSEQSIKCFNEAISLTQQFKTNYKRNSYYLMSLSYVQHINQIITGTIRNAKQQNINSFQIPVIDKQINQIEKIQNIGYLSDLSLIKNYIDKNLLDQNQQNYIDKIIAKIQNYQNYMIKMNDDLKFVRTLNDQIEIHESNGERFTLKKININCFDKNTFFVGFQKALLEILCLLRIRELDRIEYCELVQFKFEMIENGKNLQMFLIMKCFEININHKNQLIQIMDAIRILNENNIFLNNLKACQIFQHNNNPIISDFSHATFVIDSVVYKQQSQKNQISFIQNDVLYFGHFLYKIITGHVLSEQDGKDSQQFKQSLDLVEDKRMKRIIELATQPYLLRPKMIELRFLI